METKTTFGKMAMISWSSLVFFLLLLSSNISAQNTPCECAQRWTGGGTWDLTEPDLVDDSSNAPAPNGVIACASAAGTMSNIQPLGCTYDSTQFEIDVVSAVMNNQVTACIDPSSGEPDTSAVNPIQGAPIIWLNFDVRAYASDFEVQINDNNAADDIAWALYVSDTPTTGTPGTSGTGDPISGDCNALTLIAACGVESSSTWNNLPVPVFGEPTNYYMALWDRNGDSDLDINNFKARFGCGSGLACGLIVDVLGEECLSDSTYQVEVEVVGVNGEYVAFDPNALTSDTTCLTLADNMVNTVDTLYVTYPTSVTTFNIQVSAQSPANDPNCPVAVNFMECDTTVTGMAPCCLMISCISDNLDCDSGPTGTVTALPSGGTMPYAYNWEDDSNPGISIGTTASISNLGSGSYSVTVIDGNGCVVNCSATVSQPPSPTAICSNDLLACFGDNNGSVTVTASGGTAPYTYNWENNDAPGISIGTSATISGLSAGTYNATITDANGCTATCSSTVSEPLELACTTTPSDATCGLSNGSITVSALGGTGPYQYSINNGPSQGSPLFENLSPGMYTITVIDDNLCESTCDAEILEINNLSCSTSVINATCGLDNGSITVSVNNGSGNFEYELVGGSLLNPIIQNSNVFSNLFGGSYTVTVTDLDSPNGSNCTTSCDATVEETNNLSCSIVVSDANCGRNNGSLTINVNNGSGNFQYTLTGGQLMIPVVQNNNVFNNLAGGDYVVTVVDLNSTTATVCETNCIATLDEINDLSCSISASDATCGSADGGLTVNVLNGSGNFEYTLTGGNLPMPVVQNSNVFSNLAGGDYSVSVVDLNSTTNAVCTTSCVAFVDEINDLSCSITVADATCGSSDGGLTVNVLNGSGNFEYTLTGGNLPMPVVQNSNVFSNLAGGNYTVTVVDLNSTTNAICTTACNATILEVNNITCSIETTDSDCAIATGTLTVTVNNGSGSYEFTLTGGNLVMPIVQNSNVFTNLFAGNYSVSLVDLNAVGAGDCSTICEGTIDAIDDEDPEIICPTASLGMCSIDEFPPFLTVDEFIIAGGTVTDNCGLDSMSFLLINESSDNLSCPETITRTYQIMDLAGNSATCDHTIILNDTEIPDISCPADLTAVCSIDEVEPYLDLDAFLAAGGTASDNCGLDTLSFTLLSETSDNLSCPETVTRVYQIADLCGNMNTCSQTIVIDDIVVPNISCPPGLTAVCSIDEVDPYLDLDAFLAAGGTASDNCGLDTLSFTLLSETSDNLSCPETVTRIYQISDVCGNVNTCSQTVVIDDPIPPSFLIDDITILCSDDPDDLSLTGQPYNVFDNCEIKEISFTNDSTNLIQVGQNWVGFILRTWTVLDLCDNQAVLVQEITIEDNAPDAIDMDLEVCETIPGSGLSEHIDLTSLDGMISSSPDPYTVTWFEDIDLLILVTNPTDITVADGDVYYALITDVTSGCSNVAVVTYTVNDTPEAFFIMPTICEDMINSGTAIVDLTSFNSLVNGGMMGVSVNWFEDEDLLLPIPDPTTVVIQDQDTIYANLILSNCSSTIGLIFSIISMPDILVPDLTLCEDSFGSGIATADLTQYNASVNAVAQITWYDGDPDAGGLLISDPMNVVLPLISGNELYVVAGEDTECPNKALVPVTILPLPEAPVIEILACSGVNVQSIDLTEWVPEGLTVIAWYDGDPTAGGTLIVDPTAVDLPLASGNDVFYYINDGFCSNHNSAELIIHETGTLVCKDVNISMNGNCEALITPQMVLQGVYDSYIAYEVVIITLDGDTIPNPVTSDYLGSVLIVSIIDICDGNSCWSYITMEDKIAPEFVCVNDTVSCFNYVRTPPEVIDNCDTDVEVYLIDEQILNANCEIDSAFNIIYQHTWVAVDDFGNADTCTRQTFIERINWDSIQLPPHYLVADQTAVECSDLVYDDDGRLDPFVYGIPSLDGVLLYPDVDDHCNFYVTFSDFIIPTFNCVSKVMRTWTMSEWHCSGDSVRTFVQIIEISDNTPPEFTCPNDINVDALPQNCDASVTIPAIDPVDLCSTIDHIDLSTPFGFYQNTNGLTLDVPAGVHEFTYLVYDKCLNVDSCSFTVTVRDLTAPQVICDQSTVLSLSNNGLGRIYPQTIDDGSFDLCGIDSFAIARVEASCGYGTEWGPYVEFSCCDITNNPIMVMLGVWDAAGNFASCMTTVEVQDKLGPEFSTLPDISISCEYPHEIQSLDQFGTLVVINHPDDLQGPNPPIDSIVINDPNNPESQPKFWGYDAYVYDNCGIIDVSVDSVYVIDNCGEGYIKRTFTMTEMSGQTHSFDQYIYIVNFDPFDGEDIIWPLDYDATTACVPALLHPDNLPSPYSYPIVSEDACDLVGISFQDEIYQINEPNACSKIVRSWKIINWCEPGVTNNNYTEYDYQQVIKMINMGAPTFTSCEDQVACTDGLDCNTAYVELSPIAEDDCTPAQYLNWTYHIDLDDDGTFDIPGYTSNASGNYPLGSHRIVWSVEDGCGNTTSCTQHFEVNSCTQPTPYCLNGLAVQLAAVDYDNDGAPDDGTVTIWASDLDAGSYQICGNPVTVSFSPDINDISRTFTCADLGQQILELWVTDNIGNQDYCITYIIIQDNNGICTGTTSGNIQLNGQIQAPSGTAINIGNLSSNVPNTAFRGATIDLDELGQNRPNPFSDETSININLAEAKIVQLVVTDMSGQIVYEIEKECSKGKNDFIIKGEYLKTSGVYFYTIKTSSGIYTRKMIYIGK